MLPININHIKYGLSILLILIFLKLLNSFHNEDFEIMEKHYADEGLLEDLMNNNVEQSNNSSPGPKRSQKEIDESFGIFQIPKISVEDRSRMKVDGPKIPPKTINLWDLPYKDFPTDFTKFHCYQASTLNRNCQITVGSTPEILSKSHAVLFHPVFNKYRVVPDRCA